MTFSCFKNMFLLKKKSTRIKKLIWGKLLRMPKNLGVDTFPGGEGVPPAPPGWYSQSMFQDQFISVGRVICDVCYDSHRFYINIYIVAPSQKVRKILLSTQCSVQCLSPLMLGQVVDNPLDYHLFLSPSDMHGQTSSLLPSPGPISWTEFTLLSH